MRVRFMPEKMVKLIFKCGIPCSLPACPTVVPPVTSVEGYGRGKSELIFTAFSHGDNHDGDDGGQEEKRERKTRDNYSPMMVAMLVIETAGGLRKKVSFIFLPWVSVRIVNVWKLNHVSRVNINTKVNIFCFATTVMTRFR